MNIFKGHTNTPKVPIDIDGICQAAYNASMSSVNACKLMANAFNKSSKTGAHQPTHDSATTPPKKNNTKREPFTKEEQEIMDLLVDAHNMFVKIEQAHPDDKREWVDGIHKCQNVLMNRVVVRDYPDVFHKSNQL